MYKKNEPPSLINNLATKYRIFKPIFLLKTEIHTFWIQNHFCAILGSRDIYKMKCGSETDQFIFILSHSGQKIQKFVPSSSNWTKMGPDSFLAVSSNPNWNGFVFTIFVWIWVLKIRYLVVEILSKISVSFFWTPCSGTAVKMVNHHCHLNEIYNLNETCLYWVLCGTQFKQCQRKGSFQVFYKQVFPNSAPPQKK